MTDSGPIDINGIDLSSYVTSSYVTVPAGHEPGLIEGDPVTISGRWGLNDPLEEWRDRDIPATLIIRWPWWRLWKRLRSHPLQVVVRIADDD